MPALMRHNGIPMVFQPAPEFTFFDPPEIHVQIEDEAEYEQWRQWRYDHVSVEFQRATWYLANAMWAGKRPWWAKI